MEWAAIPHHPHRQGETISTLKVLIVDDEPAIVRVISRALRRAGVAVSSASSGEEALGVVAREGDFDCVLSDIMMPGISGIEMVLRLPEPLRRRVVLFTASFTEDINQDAIPDGVPVLRKPVDMVELRDAILRAAGQA